MTAAATRLALPVHEARLGNGLRVVVNPDPASGVAAVQVRYGVGSRHETPGRTGFAHLFEHLMFCGSRSVASGEHFASLQRVGGVVNGTTSFDRTNYYETVPAAGLDLALWLEADRMATLLDAVTQESLDTQREVVKEEKRQSYDNQPYGDWGFRGFEALFGIDHPYGHLPIGSMADLDAATLEDVHAFFRRHYLPGNAVLAVSGGVEPEQVVDLAEHHLGQVPAAAVPAPPPRLTATPMAEAVRVDVDDDVPSPALFRLWRAPAEHTPELEALRVALELLAAGASSRLDTILTRRSSVAAGVHGGVSPLAGGVSVMQVVLYAHPDGDLDALAEAADAELESVAADGVGEAEVETAKAQLASGYLRRLGTCFGRADELAKLALTTGEPARINGRLEALASVTPDDVHVAVRDWMSPQTAVDVRYHPTGGGA